MKILFRFLGFLFAAGTIIFVVGVAVLGGVLWHYSKDLPDYSQLQNYEPPVMTRVHAADGSLVAEYANERRLYLPIQAVPKLVISAFLAAEDKNFYEHGGLDFYGIARAVTLYAQNLGKSRRPQGASTITQQVAKNFLLTNELSMTRKLKEALLALRIERTYSKDKILELYLNQIYLGVGAYGVAAASLLYFDKSVHELDIAEAAYLAALPKGPNNYNPFRHHDEAVARRNYVIDRMIEDGYVPAAAGEKAKKEPLSVTVRPTGAHTFAAEYFAEEVRRYIFENYGEKKLYEGGLSVRTTLDPKMQVLARKAMTDGLVNFDKSQGWRGAMNRIAIDGDWGVKLAEIKSLSDIDPWRLAVVLEVTDLSARIGLQPAREPSGAVSKGREIGIVPLDGVKWAKAAGQTKPTQKVGQILAAGDVIYVDPLKDQGQFRLRQLPEISGAMVVMDPHTGRVLAMVGGFSYDQSQFNRATQALRQPGSSFKPLVYAAAIDNGYTPSTVVLDAPLEIDTGPGGGGVWKPENYGGKFYGPSTLRFGLEQSRNVMTVRLAQDIGMPLIAEYGKRFGVYDDLPPYLSYALGAGETTVLRMVTAYSMLDNGGRRVKPTLVDRIQDRYGHTISGTTSVNAAAAMRRAGRVSRGFTTCRRSPTRSTTCAACRTRSAGRSASTRTPRAADFPRCAGARSHAPARRGRSRSRSRSASGSWRGCRRSRRAPRNPFRERDHLLVLLAGGIRGFEVFMAVERDRWYGAAIREDGRVEAHAAWLAPLLAALAEVDWPSLRRAPAIALVACRADARFGLASSVIDPMTPVIAELFELGPGGAAELGRDPAAITARRWHDAVARALELAQVPYVIVDEATPSDELARYRAVIVPTHARVDRALWHRLRALAELRTTRVVIGPTTPTHDELDRPLADATPARGLGRLAAASLDDLPGLADDLAALAADLGDAWQIERPDDVRAFAYADARGAVRVVFAINDANRAHTAVVLADDGHVLRDVFTKELVRVSGGRAHLTMPARGVRMFVIERA